MLDLLLAVLDGDSDRSGALLYARTGRDVRKMSVVAGMLAEVALYMGEQALGSRADLRAALRQAAVYEQLDGLATSGRDPAQC